jgi:hypothetical protein
MRSLRLKVRLSARLYLYSTKHAMIESWYQQKAINIPGLSGQPHTLWKYNALFHFATEHAPVGQKLPAIPPELIVETFITSKEESLMGISQEDTQKWRDDNEIPNTDGLEQLKEEISAAKREQAESTVTQPPHKTPRRS